MRAVLVGAELEENLSLGYLRGALEAEGHEVTLVRFDDEGEVERAAEQVASCGAELAGFSMVFTGRAREFARLVSRCRERGLRGLSVAGGHFAAFHAERLLRDLPALDAVAIGEGERILCELARQPRDLGRVAGLVWRDGETLRRNPPATPEPDLDRLPWPARNLRGSYLGLPIANLIGSRGCTHSCAFCSIAAWHALCGGERYRARSPESIAAEVGCLARQGVRIFNFHDDNFLGRDRAENLARVRALSDALAREQVGKIAFQIKARPDAIDPELFAFLRAMGLFRVFLGIEAGTEASLQRLGRGQRLEDNLRALEILNRLDLHVAFNLLLLNPDSTLEDLAGNVAFLRAHLQNPMNFCRTEIYAGTPLERRLRGQGRLRGDYWGLDYRIADERAQQAFGLIRLAFNERNFGAHPLHYLSGQVDYEHQLRADLFGTPPELRAAAKGFVCAVNENSVSHLETIVAAIAGGEASAAFARELAALVANDDLRLRAAGEAVLARIRALPVPRARSGSKRSRTALAASLALALVGGCSDDSTQHMEAAPRPTCDGKGGGYPWFNPDPAYSVSAGGFWEGTPRRDGAKLDGSLARDLGPLDAGSADGGTLPGRVFASATLNRNTSDPLSFVGDPVLSGARLLSVKREPISLSFSFAPDPGVKLVQVLIKVDCASIAGQARFSYDVSNPTPGATVPVSQIP